jgi:hypothetical protein
MSCPRRCGSLLKCWNWSLTVANDPGLQTCPMQDEEGSEAMGGLLVDNISELQLEG